MLLVNTVLKELDGATIQDKEIKDVQIGRNQIIPV